jgi:alpha-beta hydrolase superfamily lysophospholipase
MIFNQEKLIFFPDKLKPDYQYSFHKNFEEYFISVDKEVQLNGLLFKSDSSKGLIFYLHGNAGSLDSWGHVADLYLKNNYDIFILDYRGFGKSQGKINNEKQLHNDIQIVYNQLKKSYNEDKIVIIGYSLGTGLASRLTANNNPGLLILIAPYYNFVDLIHHYYSFIPSVVIKYRFMTNKQIPKITVPIIIFHGNQDEVIYYESSKKLKLLLKPTDKLITLNGQSHNGINDNTDYINHINHLLK